MKSLSRPHSLPSTSLIFFYPKNRERNGEVEAAMAAKPIIKVAALCGSLRKGSYNRGLIRSGTIDTVSWFGCRIFVHFHSLGDFESGSPWVAAIEISKESINGLQIEYVEVSQLPMINTDLEVDGKCPPEVEEFRQKILQADAILFASPEYNYSVSRTYYCRSPKIAFVSMSCLCSLQMIAVSFSFLFFLMVVCICSGSKERTGLGIETAKRVGREGCSYSEHRWRPGRRSESSVPSPSNWSLLGSSLHQQA